MNGLKAVEIVEVPLWSSAAGSLAEIQQSGFG